VLGGCGARRRTRVRRNAGARHACVYTVYGGGGVDGAAVAAAARVGGVYRTSKRKYTVYRVVDGGSLVARTGLRAPGSGESTRRLPRRGEGERRGERRFAW
jgi:hypothetical protein